MKLPIALILSISPLTICGYSYDRINPAIPMRVQLGVIDIPFSFFNPHNVIPLFIVKINVLKNLPILLLLRIIIP
jgi:hypothetical protein